MIWLRPKFIWKNLLSDRLRQCSSSGLLSRQVRCTLRNGTDWEGRGNRQLAGYRRMGLAKRPRLHDHVNWKGRNTWQSWVIRKVAEETVRKREIPAVMYIPERRRSDWITYGWKAPRRRKFTWGNRLQWWPFKLPYSKNFSFSKNTKPKKRN